MSTSIARHILEGMRLAGIRQLFCLPGVQNDDFFDAVVDNRDWLEVVVTRHEQGCAYLAMGAAMATGRPTAMCVVPGPGVLNAAAGLSSACGGGARVLAITGQIATRVLGRGIRVLHEIDDQPAVLAQVSKYVAAIRSAEGAVEVLQAAFDALVSGTPRPVAIEVPQDLWGKAADGSMQAPIVSMPVPDVATVDRVADMLRRAERPLIWVGTGAQDCAPAIRELAERLQAPVTTRRMGHGVMDEGLAGSRVRAVRHRRGLRLGRGGGLRGRRAGCLDNGEARNGQRQYDDEQLPLHGCSFQDDGRD